jgi:anti-sigma B factor antagonist
MTPLADLEIDGRVGRLTLRGEIDLTVVPELAAVLDRARDGHVTSLEVDLALVDFLDSSGLGFIAQAAAALEDVRIVAAPISVVRIFEMTGLGSLIALGSGSEGS